MTRSGVARSPGSAARASFGVTLYISDRITTAALPMILAGVDELLGRRGFRRRLYDAQLDRHRYSEWVRDRGFIDDRVSASYRDGAPHMLDLGVAVYLHLRPGRDIDLDGTSVNYVNGRLLTYEFPIWRALAIRSPGRLAEIMIEETDRALAWFDQYRTPAFCLERLASPERNGVRVGTAPHTEAARLLEELVATDRKQ